MILVCNLPFCVSYRNNFEVFTMFNKIKAVATAILGFSAIACNSNDIANASNKKDSALSKVEKQSSKPEVKVEVNQDSLKFARKQVIYDSSKTYIYLTFDDGPHWGTNECVKVCTEQGIKATFFMVGRHSLAKGEGEKAKKIRESYPQFLLANHTFSHANEHYKYFYQHPLISSQDIFQAQQTLNVPYKIVRLAGNSAWVRKSEIKSSQLTKPVCKILDSAGYNVIGWDVEWNFTRGTSYPVQTPEKLYNQVVNAEHYSHTKNHIVILTHDRMFRTPAFSDSLAKFIALVKQNPKYVFETVDNYPNLKF